MSSIIDKYVYLIIDNMYRPRCWLWKRYYSGSICAGVCNVLRVSSLSLDVLMYIVDVLSLSVLV